MRPCADRFAEGPGGDARRGLAGWITRLEAKIGQGAGEMDDVFARAAGDLEHHPRARQNSTQDFEDRVAIAQGGRGKEARIALLRPGRVRRPGLRCAIGHAGSERTFA